MNEPARADPRSGGPSGPPRTLPRDEAGHVEEPFEIHHEGARHG